MIDWAKVNTLLDVLDGTNPQKWPNLRPIHDLAMQELNSMIEDIAKPKPPKPVAPPEPREGNGNVDRRI